MRHRTHQVCAYVPRPPRKDRMRALARWVLAIVLGGVLGIVLTGCTKRPEAVKTVDEGHYNMDVFTDNATGCQYIGLNDAAVTPRIAADGVSHMGCISTQQGKQ